MAERLSLQDAISTAQRDGNGPTGPVLDSTIQMETPGETFRITMERDDGRTLLVTRRRGPDIRPDRRPSAQNGPEPQVPGPA